ncbi:MAG TPA: hypothetical protein VG847_11000 [Chitinophagaceae bacterium]|nr:hypothetical protein [Chitinophagaceae bacterium]
MKIMLLSALILIISPAFSQQGKDIVRPAGAANGTLPIPLAGTSQVNLGSDAFIAIGEGYKSANNSGDISGNPYLFDDWRSGEVTLKNGENYKIAKMNFDASQNKFIYVAGDSIYEFLNNIREVKIYGNADAKADMIFRTDINPNAANYVQVIAKGKITIFCDYIKKPEGENYSNGIVKETRKYMLHKNYYYISNDSAIPLKFTSSELLALSSDKGDLVNSYIKSNHLKVKREDDFINAVQYYNSLN